MAYLVTGGTGFIGSRVVRDLVKANEKVVIYDLFPDETNLKHLLSEEERARIKIVRADLTDLTCIIHTCEENDIEKIIHLGAILGGASSANPLLALKVISEGTINVLETARILRLKKVVWSSSITVFGPPQKYAEEYLPNDALYGPSTIYGSCKALNETIAAHYFKHFDVDVTAIRYSAVYGFARHTPGPWTKVCQELLEKPAVGKPGRVRYGDDVPDWLYVDDAARVTLMAANTPRTKTRAYNISGELRSMKEVAECVRKLLPGADISLLPGIFGTPWKCDTTAIREELGFQPQWTVEQGIRVIINFTRQQYGLPPV